MDNRSLQQFENSAEAFAGRIEKRSLWLLGVFSVLYLTGTYIIATRKLLWNDELYTLYISRLPDLSAVWSALLSGGEQNPPFFYVITRASFALLGVNEFSIRLPEILGFWVMCLCLFRFVSVATRPVYGLVAAFFPLFTGAYYYASEARPYGLVMGFAALSLVCWQSATRKRHYLLSLIFLSLSLAAALANHYYAVLVFVALAFGELVRTMHRRKIDLPIWLAFGAAVFPLLLVLPLIKRAKAYGGTFWSPANWLAIPDFYAHQMTLAVMVLLLLLFLAALYTTVFALDDKRHLSAAYPLPPWCEIAAACGFALIPVMGVALGKFVTGAFTDRYVMTAIIGISVLIAFVAYKLLRGRAAPCFIFVLAFSLWFLIAEFRLIQDVTYDARGQAQAISKLQSQTTGDLPIVAADAHTIVDLAHYAPPDINSRLVYLADPEISLRRLGYNSVDLGMIDLIKPWFGLNIQAYKPYVSSHPEFFVYGDLGFLSWLVPELQADGRRLEMLDKNGGKFLFLVHHKQSANDANLVK